MSHVDATDTGTITINNILYFQILRVLLLYFIVLPVLSCYTLWWTNEDGALDFGKNNITRMLGAVLNIVPDYWNDANYDSKQYHLFELNNEDDEYINEMEAFDRNRITVTKLERIQNPFQFGRFQIRKEQKHFRNNIVEKIKCYHCISQGDLNIALEHNLDVRRYVTTKGDGFQSEKKNPKFYRNLSDAYNSITCSNKVILICDILGRGNVDTYVPTNDTEYMPTYVAYLS